ncbi:Uncharacterised protein [Bordetella pertussis]|nr:Uncharacterised protein [Bordetella pertussis]
MAARQLVQAADTLDGMHLAHDLGQYRRLPAARAAQARAARRPPKCGCCCWPA